MVLKGLKVGKRTFRKSQIITCPFLKGFYSRGFLIHPVPKATQDRASAPILKRQKIPTGSQQPTTKPYYSALCTPLPLLPPPLFAMEAPPTADAGLNAGCEVGVPSQAGMSKTTFPFARTHLEVFALGSASTVFSPVAVTTALFRCRTPRISMSCRDSCFPIEVRVVVFGNMVEMPRYVT